MPLGKMTSQMMDAVHNYTKALHEGKVGLPEGCPEIGQDEEETIRRMLSLHAVLRVKDHNAVVEVVAAMTVIHPDFLQSALEFQPQQKYLM